MDRRLPGAKNTVDRVEAQANVSPNRRDCAERILSRRDTIPLATGWSCRSKFRSTPANPCYGSCQTHNTTLLSGRMFSEADLAIPPPAMPGLPAIIAIYCLPSTM
jgi:hypothetical protein